MAQERRKILIIDDDQDLLAAIANVFGMAGFQVSIANDGMAAMLKIDAERFDAIITDVHMPRMNGLQVAANAKASALNSRTPFFIMSGATDSEILKRAVEFRAVNILPKPFDIDKLLSSVRATLQFNGHFTSHRPDIAACFAKGASDILKFYFGDNVVVGGVTAPGDITLNFYASATVALFGDGASGFLTLSFKPPFIRMMSEALFPGADVTTTDVLSGEIAGELANQVAGRVTTNLSGVGVEVAIGLPQVVLGHEHKLMRKDGGPILRFEIEVNDCTILIDFGLRQTNGR